MVMKYPLCRRLTYKNPFPTVYIWTVSNLPNSTSRHLCPHFEFLFLKKFGKAGKRLKMEKASPGIPHPRDSGHRVSSMNPSMDGGRSCLLYSTKEQNINTFQLLHVLPTPGLVAAEASLPRVARPSPRPLPRFLPFYTAL